MTLGFEVEQRDFAVVHQYAALDGLEDDGVLDAVLRTIAGARLGSYYFDGTLWRPASPTDLSVLPAIGIGEVTSVTTDDVFDVDDASDFSEGDVVRAWDSSAGAELGDFTIDSIDGSEITLTAEATGIAQYDLLYRVADMGTFTVGDSTRDFTLDVNLRADFNGSGVLCSLLDSATSGELLLPWTFALGRAAVARFGSGMTIADTLNHGVVLHVPGWDDLYAGIGTGVRAMGSSVYQAANYRAGAWVAGVAGATPSTRRAIWLENVVGILRGSAPPTNQLAYATAAAGGADTDEERLSILLLGATTSALLTGFYATSINVS